MYASTIRNELSISGARIQQNIEKLKIQNNKYKKKSGIKDIYIYDKIESNIICSAFMLGI